MDNLLKANGYYVSRTPLRISFFGGGTDLADFYRQDYGAVLSTTIDKFLYVTVKRHGNLFNEPIRLNYSETEMVQEIDAIHNDIIRECMRFLKIEPPIYINTVSDVPASSGLGSSSSFAVGLLHALYAMRRERVSAGRLAEEACYIEIDVLKKPIGKQDQYAAAFGGLNYIQFKSNGGVTVEPQTPPNAIISNLFNHLMMFWTGLSRESAVILKEQKENTIKKLEQLRFMREYASDMRNLLSQGELDLQQFGKNMHQSWQMKRQLASKISSDYIDLCYQKAIAAGAYGGKITGAGGGGFLLLVVKPEKQNRIRKVLDNLQEIPINAEVAGSRLLLPNF